MTHYHSDVVGSLLRPPYLIEARGQLEAGRITATEFKRIEDRAVDEVVALQEASGVEAITDGEQRRYAFWSHLTDSLAGYDKTGGWGLPFQDEKGEEYILQRPVVVEKLRPKRNMCAEEFTYLRARATRPAKATFLSVMQAAAYYDVEKSCGAYPTREAYLADIVEYTRREVEELIRLGCTYIQVDGPQYAGLADPKIRAGYLKRGGDPDKLLDTAIEMDNAVIDGHPDGVTFALHICRGNVRSKWYVSGGYDPVAAKVFRETHFQRFLLEYDDSRSGTFAPLREMPEDRTVVLGLVSSKKPRLEAPDELKQRIEEAAEFVSMERLALSPQCGFATVLEGNIITADDQQRKLELVSQVARELWGSE